MTERKNITQPADWWAAFAAEAAANNQSLSQWIGAAAVACLPQDVRRRLSARPDVGRPKAGEEAE